jgi:hypothetical protein
MATQTTGLDSAFALDAIYYSAPIPRNAGALTILGAVFDRVYFPGVYMPKGGYDAKELQKEIERLKALSTPSPGRGELIAILEFVKHVKTLDGFCVFTGDRDDPFLDRNKVPGAMVRDFSSPSTALRSRAGSRFLTPTATRASPAAMST